MDKEQIYKLLTKEIDPELIKKDEPMCKHTSFKIGGNADIFITTKTKTQLDNILKTLKKYEAPLTILGNGTNLLVKDRGIRGITLKIDLDEIEIQKSNNTAIVKLGAGVKNAFLAQVLLAQEIAGFEFAAGIPGTIGGAVYMNAGAYGAEMKDIVKEVTYLDISNLQEIKEHTISNKECQFDYRHSTFNQKNVIITKVTIELPYGKKENIKQKMDENAKARKEKQPVQMPSAGSTFRRGTDFITAKLIDECGLKGYQIGGAQVSNVHAGFIVNAKSATAQDVINLIEYVQKTVLQKCGKQIELEVKIIGE